MKILARRAETAENPLKKRELNVARPVMIGKIASQNYGQVS
jgi:hypothetical protein